MASQHISEDSVPEPGSRGVGHQGHQPRRILRRLQERSEGLSMGAHLCHLLETFDKGAVDANGKDPELGCGFKGIDAHAWRFPL